MKVTKISAIIHFFIIFIIPIECSADALTDRLNMVLKKLGCETPYMVTENSGSGEFYAETRLKDPTRIHAYGFSDAETGNIVSIRESIPGEYWVKVVSSYDMLDLAEEKHLTVEINPANKKFTDISTTGIIIKGIITNLVDVKNFYSSSTYIQLVDISLGAKPKLAEIDGFINVESNLAKAKLSPSGSFEIKTNYIKPGNYWLYLQNLKPASEIKPTPEAILAKGNQYYQIFISENVKSLIFDCGNLSIIIH
jgi:hypothetical protein